MNDTTQATATAKTALGCLNGLAAEPGWALLNLVVLLGDGVRAGESVKRGQRRGQRGTVRGV